MVTNFNWWDFKLKFSSWLQARKQPTATLPFIYMCFFIMQIILLKKMYPTKTFKVFSIFHYFCILFLCLLNSNTYTTYHFYLLI